MQSEQYDSIPDSHESKIMLAASDPEPNFPKILLSDIEHPQNQKSTKFLPTNQQSKCQQCSQKEGIVVASVPISTQ